MFYKDYFNDLIQTNIDEKAWVLWSWDEKCDPYNYGQYHTPLILLLCVLVYLYIFYSCGGDINLIVLDLLMIHELCL